MKYVTVTVFGLLFPQQIRKRFSISQVKENVKNGSFYWIFVIKLWKPWTWELKSQLKQCCPIIFAAAFWVGACVVKQSSKHCNEHKLVITWIALDTSAARPHLLMPLLNSLSLSLSSSFIIICTTNCTNRIWVHCAAMHIFAFLWPKNGIIHVVCQWKWIKWRNQNICRIESHYRYHHHRHRAVIVEVTCCNDWTISPPPSISLSSILLLLFLWFVCSLEVRVYLTIY